MNAMTWKVLRPLSAFAAVLAVPALACAQQAVISGTVTDNTGKPVASVSVTLMQVASGDKTVVSTDASGNYHCRSGLA